MRDLQQLFNSLDPSPFPERDLDPAAEAFLVGWVQELPRDVPLTLELRVAEQQYDPTDAHRIGNAIRHYFAGRAEQSRVQIRERLRQGRFNLLMGLAVLALCLVLAESFGDGRGTGLFGNVFYDGLTILGWVAMWRPLETFLFDYWHWRRQRKIFLRMSRMWVEMPPASPVEEPVASTG